MEFWKKNISVGNKKKIISPEHIRTLINLGKKSKKRRNTGWINIDSRFRKAKRNGRLICFFLEKSEKFWNK